MSHTQIGGLWLTIESKNVIEGKGGSAKKVAEEGKWCLRR
jgi:hypothetical protein